MQEILQFIVKHWLLSLALVVVLILLLIEEIRAKGRGGAQIMPSKAVQLINHEQALVLDIRDQNSFKEGHIIGALNIPEVDLERNLHKLNKSKQSPIIVVCSNGMKSSQIAGNLRKQGFAKAVALAGGLNAWKNANLPIIKD